MKQQFFDKNKWILYLLLLLLSISPRAIGVDRFVTVDEPWWIISGSNYYYALTHQDFAHTIYDYHPAVTTTWVVTAGMLSYFPEYRGFGQGYFDVRKPDFENFLRLHGKEAIELVRISRLIQSGLLAGLALLNFYLLQILIDRKAALLSIAFAINAPFFLGHSRLLNHEGILALFVLSSLLAMRVYLTRKKIIFLLISGAAFGLAQLTKSTSIILVPLIGWMLLSEIWKPGNSLFQPGLWGQPIKTGVVWLVTAIIVFVILWPGMWAAPGKMIFEIYGNAFSYAFQGARLDLTENLQPSSFQLITGFSGIWQFIIQWAGSSTLVSLSGVILAVLLWGTQDKDFWGAPVPTTIAYMSAIALMFILLFGVARGRDSAHYILTSYFCLDVVAGMGWFYFLTWAQKRLLPLKQGIVFSLILFGLLMFQLGSTLPYYPYYYNYKNFLATSAATVGYGEGLDQAAVHLTQKPDAQTSTAFAYAGRGAFSYFYSGETEALKRTDLFTSDISGLAKAMQKTDYLVIYTIAQNGLPGTEALSGYLHNIPPEKIILIHDIEYARIYKISDIPQSVFEEMTQ